MVNQHDVIIIGAGFSGLYAVHKLRDELGLDVHGFDAAGGVGGTWWWNRYPGCRCDFESIHYSYSFSDDLQERWQWSEKFAAQPEILAYLEWVADELDLRRSFTFSTRVTSAVWDDALSLWAVTTDDGVLSHARYVVSCVGVLSVPKAPEFGGADTFGGELYRTSSWPHEPVDLGGKRVAVIGTGSTGIQVIQEVAKDAEHLTVFQRSPVYAAPLGNAPLDRDQRRWNAEHHAELRAGSRQRFIGVPYDLAEGPYVAATDERRREIFDKYYDHGGFPLLVSTFNDILFSEDANDAISEYLREKIRERVEDPEVAALLTPTDHPYGSKRPPFETNYFETYNRDNVELVDISTVPISEITETGIRTGETVREFDVIILATGFDAITAPQVNLNMTGRGGITLADKWADGPVSLLGSQVSGFPNYFTIVGPQSTAVFYNAPLAIEDAIDFAAAAITRADATTSRTIEPTEEAEQVWGELCSGLLALTLIPRAEKAWWLGGNIAGKSRGAYMFVGGAPLYRAMQADVLTHDFAGFTLDGTAAPLSPLLRLSPTAALVLGTTLVGDQPAAHEMSLEDIREQNAALIQLQAPGPAVRVETTDTPHARIYRPDDDAGPRPVIVYFHGGGFLAGSIDLVDSPARLLAANLGVVVVVPEYRLAPENPFPAATDDTVAALEWVRDHIADHGGDADRIIVAGDSSGATLAAVAALRARDAGLALAGQILLTPVVDPDARTESRTTFANGPMLTSAAIDAMWGVYLGAAQVTELAAPSRASTLAGVAPALVVTVEVDPVRDEGEQYADALEAAGVPVRRRRFDGLFHGALSMTAVIPEIAELYGLIGGFVAEHAARQAESKPA